MLQHQVEDLHLKFAAQNGRGLHHLFYGFGEPIQPGNQEMLQGVGQERCAGDGYQSLLALGESRLFSQKMENLLGKEGIAHAALAQKGQQARCDRLAQVHLGLFSQCLVA